MSKVLPCLWFDGEAEQAAQFYVSLLPNSNIETVQKNPADGPAGKAGSVLVVEFTLAFAMVWTPLARRIAAAMLLGPFIGAIPEFGKIDAIGHSCIIAVLVVILADDMRMPIRIRRVCATPLGYSVALTVFLLGYYGLHQMFFGAGVG